MSPKQQNIAIAKLCPHVARIDGAGVPVWNRDSREEFEPTSDLNACHEMEAKLTIGQRVEFCREVIYIWTTRNDRAVPNWWLLHDATAAQRCEAFLRTINKWDDSK